MTELLSQTLTAFTIGLLGSGHCLAMCGGIMGALSMRSLAAGGASESAGGANESAGGANESAGGANESAGRANERAGGARLGASRARESAGGVNVIASTATMGAGAARSSSLFSQLLLYSTGRLLSYAVLGLALGLLGAVLVTAMEPARIVLRGLAGGLLIAMGLYLAGLWHGILLLERFGHRLWRRVGPSVRDGNGSTLLLGMTWGLLPCGLVYGTLAWAASAADPLLAGWLMLAFGLGTLPAVMAGSWFSAAMLAPLRRRGLRLAAGALIVAFGIWTLIGGGVWPSGGGHDHHHGNHVESLEQTTGSLVSPDRSVQYGRA